jgi:hypothetical protein
LGGFGSHRSFELGIRPLLTSLPKGLHLSTEVLSGLHLMAYQFGLRLGNETGVGAATHSAGEAEVGAMAGLGVVGAGTAGLTALDVAFRERAATHGLRLSELQGQITNARRDL